MSYLVLVLFDGQWIDTVFIVIVYCNSIWSLETVSSHAC
jgi:hypothetical protein